MATQVEACAGWRSIASEILAMCKKPQFWLDVVQTFKDEIRSLIRIILDKYNALSNAAIDLDSQFKTLLENLKRAITIVQKYEDHICKLHRYGSNAERAEKIRRGIERSNFTLLTEFITQLDTVYRVRADESCRDAERALENVRSSAQNLSTVCKKRAVEATTATTLSGTLTAGGIGTGAVLLASVVAGVGTFGIGTVVGLGLASAVSFGGGSSVCKYLSLRTEFENLSKSFDDVMLSAQRLCDSTRAMILNLESLSTALDLTKEARQSHEGPSYITSSFELLCEEVKKCDPHTYKGN